jgi:hypothetical protein
MNNKIVRVRFWQQETDESGRWLVTEPMSIETAEKLIAQGIYDTPDIVDED